MARLHLRLLGPISVSVNDEQLIELPYDKVRALLAYLAVEQERAHARDYLAGMLWPERPERSARHSLSQALWSLRQSTDAHLPDSPLLVARRDAVQFDSTSEHWVDVREFSCAAGGCDQHRPTPMSSCAACVQNSTRAVDLYRGDFLDGLSIDDSPGFEEWVRDWRETYRRRLGGALSILRANHEFEGELLSATAAATRLVELDPLDEQAQRSLMRLLAASGQRSAALRRFERFTSLLAEELDIEPDDETVRLYERIRAGLDGPTGEPPVASLGVAHRSSLPSTPAPFVGREREVTELVELLGRGDARLITLTGPGGIGKTHLARHVSNASVARFADGVHFVPLASLDSPDGLPAAVLGAMSVPAGGPAGAREQLFAYLRPREALLVLDSFEHVIDGAVLISELLAVSPALRIIATSRERLSLVGEWVYDVDGLDRPSDDDPETLASADASRMFMLCAKKHNASYRHRPEDGPAVVRICYLTGGMPLALELAAGWTPVLSPDEIADEIEHSLDFLASSMRDLPERHRSARAVIDRSWTNLTDVEQRAFRRLSVFEGGFERAAAHYVTGTSLPVLSALTRKSVLRRQEGGRYEIHELLRQYGSEQLAGSDVEHCAVRDRHRDFFLGFLAVREEQLQGRAQEVVLPELRVETDNIRLAWQRAIETGDAVRLGQAAHSLWLFSEITGRYSEGANAMSDAFDALRATESRTGVKESELRRSLAKLRARQSALEFRLSGPEKSLLLVEEARALLDGVDDSAEIGLILNFMASNAHVRGEHHLEETWLLESIEQFERAGDRWGTAYSMNDLGQLRAQQGNYLDARALYQSALVILEDLGDRRGIAFVLRNLGVVAYRLGNEDLAFALLRKSVDVRRVIGNRWGIAESLKQLGLILRESGDDLAAASHLCEALEIARDIGAMQLANEIRDAYLPLLPQTSPEYQSLTASTAPENVSGSHWNSTGSSAISGGTDARDVAQVVDKVIQHSDEASSAPGTETGT